MKYETQACILVDLTALPLEYLSCYPRHRFFFNFHSIKVISWISDCREGIALYVLLNPVLFFLVLLSGVLCLCPSSATVAYKRWLVIWLEMTCHGAYFFNFFNSSSACHSLFFNFTDKHNLQSICFHDKLELFWNVQYA